MSDLTLRDRIADDRVHVVDGAMGTLLYSRGVFVNVCYDALALERPDLIRTIHAEYVAAGAGIIETNTFGANPVKLSAYGLDADTEALNEAAARLARQATEKRPDVHVLGAVGPLGIRIEPWGPTSREEAEAHFLRQVDGLLEGGVHGFCLETFGDLHELEAAFRAVRRACDLPVFCQVTVGEDGATPYGTSAADAARTLTAMGADVVGLNCSVGPAAILEAVETMEAHTDLPLSAQPNAGLPRTVRDRKIYMASPEYMARYARRLIEAGVRFVGGCCGTTPDHVKLIAGTVRSLQPRHAHVRPVEPEEGVSVAAVPPISLGDRSALGRRLAEGSFVTTVEMLPPRGWDGGDLLEDARRLGQAGVDCLSLVDSPRSVGRMGAIAAGLILARERADGDEGTPGRIPEPLVHYTCRDRNMMGMIGDLLGAAAGGVRNLLVVSGDPPVQGPYPDSTAVFDIDSIGLTNVLAGLNHGVDPGGGPVGEPTPFVVGVAANPDAVDMEREVRRFMWKAEAGADFVVTQPVFAAEDLEAFLERTARWPVPVLVGVWPLTSMRNADFLAHEVPGVVVPERVLERMRRASEKGGDHARREGVAIALEVLEAVKGMERVAGVAVTAPGGDVDAALDVLAAR